MSFSFVASKCRLIESKGECKTLIAIVYIDFSLNEELFSKTL